MDDFMDTLPQAVIDLAEHPGILDGLEPAQSPPMGGGTGFGHACTAPGALADPPASGRRAERLDAAQGTRWTAATVSWGQQVVDREAE